MDLAFRFADNACAITYDALPAAAVAPQATVIAFGDRLPATAVARINGAMAQARDSGWRA